MRLWTLSLLTVGLALPALAQRTDPVAVELANMRQDLRLLQQTVGELKFQVEELERRNRDLSSQAEAGRSAVATLTQLNEAISNLQHTFDAALNGQRADLQKQFGAQLAKLAKETDAAIASVAKNQAARTPITTTFTDNFPKEGVTHTVQTGESLAAIAKKYGVPMKDIQNANRIADISKVRVGQQLFIPGAKPSP